MQVSLLVTTYNWPEALELSILSVFKQSILPDEIIIADDGSGKETNEIITKLIKESPIPIIHSWQEDDGFRAARSRNLAISKAKNEYIICIDGDMLLDKYFIEDHIKASDINCYIQGSRVLFNDEYSIEVLKEKKLIKPSLFDKRVRNKLNMIRLPFLSKIIGKFSSKQFKGIRSCNFSFYKKDFLAVNGFNEDLITWGREDSELIARMYNNGISRKNLKFAAIQYHIYHKEGNSNSYNDAILKKAIDDKLIYIKNGIDKHFRDKA